MINYIIKLYYQSFTEEMECAHAWRDTPSLSTGTLYLYAALRRVSVKVLGSSCIKGVMLLNKYLGTTTERQTHALCALRLLRPSPYLISLFQQPLTPSQLRYTIATLEQSWGRDNPFLLLKDFDDNHWAQLASELKRQRLVLTQRVSDAPLPLKEDFEQIKELYRIYVAGLGDDACQKFLAEPAVECLLEHFQQYLLPGVSQAVLQTEILREQIIASEIAKVNLKKELRELFFRVLSHGDFAVLPYFFSSDWRQFNQLVETNIVQKSYDRAVIILQHHLLQLTEQLYVQAQQKRLNTILNQAITLYENYKGDLTSYQSIVEKILLEPEVVAATEAGFEDFRLAVLTKFNSRDGQEQIEQTINTLLASKLGAFWVTIMHQGFETVIFKNGLSSEQLGLITQSKDPGAIDLIRSLKGLRRVFTITFQQRMQERINNCIAQEPTISPISRVKSAAKPFAKTVSFLPSLVQSDETGFAATKKLSKI